MQFLVLASDGDDEGALDRRMAARHQHIVLGDSMVQAGSQLFGVARLDDAGKMVGSALIVDFGSRDELDAWLEVEPYVTGGVWKEIIVERCQVGPSFAELFKT